MWYELEEGDAYARCGGREGGGVITRRTLAFLSKAQSFKGTNCFETLDR